MRGQAPGRADSRMRSGTSRPGSASPIPNPKKSAPPSDPLLLLTPSPSRPPGSMYGEPGTALARAASCEGPNWLACLSASWPATACSPRSGTFLLRAAEPAHLPPAEPPVRFPCSAHTLRHDPWQRGAGQAERGYCALTFAGISTSRPPQLNATPLRVAAVRRHGLVLTAL